MSKRLSILLALIAGISLSAAQEEPKITSYHVLSNLHLPSLAQQEAEEKKAAAELAKQNAATLEALAKKKSKIKVKDLKTAPLGLVEKLNIIYELFSHNDPIPGSKINYQLYQDLEFFCGYAPNQSNNLLGLFSPTTTMGKVELQKLLALPTTDVATLAQRQGLIQELINKPALLAKLEQQLEILKQHESEFLSFWKPFDSASAMLFDRNYFDSLTKLNKNECALEASAVWKTLISPSLSPAILGTSFGWLAYKYFSLPQQTRLEILEGIAWTFSSMTRQQLALGTCLVLIYAGFFAYGIYLPIVTAIEDNRASNLIQQKMINVASFSNALQSINATLAENAPCSDTLKEFQAMLNANTFKGTPSLFSFKGKALAAFKIMLEVKDQFEPILKKIGEIDAFVSVAKFLKEHMNNKNAQFCFAEYELAEKPHIALTNFWHPRIDQNKVVTNNFEFGGQNQAPNATITGPNAGGKSTILKGIAISLILAQTLGIAPASRMIFTPFTQINTYLNISDTPTASLYQAEMRRASALISSIKALKQGQFSFVIMDEIFTGTDPQQGSAGAYGVAKNLATFDNSLCMLATHFKLLTKLEEKLPGKFKNYKVFVHKNSDGSYTMPYKITEGATDQQIALDLLQSEGFSDDIINDAQEQLALMMQA